MSPEQRVIAPGLTLERAYERWQKLAFGVVPRGQLIHESVDFSTAWKKHTHFEDEEVTKTVFLDLEGPFAVGVRHEDGKVLAMGMVGFSWTVIRIGWMTKDGFQVETPEEQ